MYLYKKIFITIFWLIWILNDNIKNKNKNSITNRSRDFRIFLWLIWILNDNIKNKNKNSILND